MGSSGIRTGTCNSSKLQRQFSKSMVDLNDGGLHGILKHTNTGSSGNSLESGVGMDLRCPDEFQYSARWAQSSERIYENLKSIMSREGGRSRERIKSMDGRGIGSSRVLSKEEGRSSGKKERTKSRE